MKNDSIRESAIASIADEEKQNTTITKFIANIDYKYQTNLASDAKRRKRREEEIYEDDFNGWKKVIDFIDASQIKETPNISNASNFKSYGNNENDSGKHWKKFIRHIRTGSDQINAPIPVKEVCINEYYNNYNDRISNLKNLWEPYTIISSIFSLKIKFISIIKNKKIKFLLMLILYCINIWNKLGYKDIFI